MTHKLFNRLGAFGFTAALTLGSGGMLARSCAPAPAASISSPMPVSATIVQIVNDNRAANGLPPVSEDAALDNAAIAQSQDQARRQLMTHAGSNGSSAGARITANGFRWSTWGENVAAGQPTADSVMTAWMNSAGHRANILNGSFASIGIGAVRGTNGLIYWTMDLATAR
jgi:uncharacterized protein YkwD